MSSTGTFGCDGTTCSASAPADSLCPAPPPPAPTCADFGEVGTYPACSAPPTPSCADFGQVGTYPACSAPAPPPPAPTCADFGETGTYPDCSAPPSGNPGNGGSGGGSGPGGSCTNPTVAITASPDRVKSGQTSTLTVTGSGLSQACTVTGPGVNQTVTPNSCAASASIPTPPITTQSTFTVTCPDVTGSANISVIINLNPVFTPF
ncbi:MAG TPA: hypothetical protein VGN56_02470 [Candidatus Paceibacterota bacterium]|nr:hypothetical protein [Candidatus Paceibacterota bacterium]